jgi:hypothetical protein
MLKKIFIPSIALILFATACEKESKIDVYYLITDSSTGFEVNYRDRDGILQNEKITTQSAEDTWTYSYEAMEGDIVFVSAIYKDISSAIKVQILLDGKIFKEGASTGDTTKYVTVSGTVPFK